MSASAIETAESPAPKTPASRLLWAAKLILIFAALMLVVAAILLAAFAWDRHQRHVAALETIQAHIAALRAAGEPLTAEEMAAFHRLPAGTTDTTPAWLRVVELALRMSDEDRKFLNHAAELHLTGLDGGSQDSEHEVAAFVERHWELIAATLIAASLDGESRFPMEFEKGFDAELPHVEGLTYASLILALRHRLAVARGQKEPARESLDGLFGIQQSLEWEPHILGELVRINTLKRFHHELQRFVNTFDLDDSQLAEVQSRLEGVRFHSHALRGERALGFHAFLHNGRIVEHEDATKVELHDLEEMPRRATDCRFFLETMQALIVEANAAQDTLPTGRHTLALHLRELRKKPWWQRTEFELSEELLDLTAWRFRHLADAEARRRTAIAGIAVLRYRRQHGRAPKQLDELVPQFLSAVPADPHDNPYVIAPLGFETRGQTIAIYSVGANQVADHTIFADPEGGQDIGFVVQWNSPSAPENRADSPPGRKE
jgi:hypothetical protein